MQTKLINKDGKEIGTVKLDEKIFKQKVNKSLLWENVNVLRSNMRSGCASTKTKDQVRGGGKKPWRQKGIGWARHGTNRSPIWKGGGVVFGPKPRDYSVTMPKKKKIKALFASLSAKAIEQKIIVIDDIALESFKTREFALILKNMNLATTATLVAVEVMSKNLKLASRNIPNIYIKRASDINCFDVLSADYLLFTKKGLEKLEQRCSTKK